MKTLLVKRLESSFYAFKKSIGRLKTAIDNMIDMFEHDTIFIAPGLDINKLFEDDYTYDEIEAKITDKGGNNRRFHRDDFDEKFIELL
jgi:hypothetical protein